MADTIVASLEKKMTLSFLLGRKAKYHDNIADLQSRGFIRQMQSEDSPTLGSHDSIIQ